MPKAAWHNNFNEFIEPVLEKWYAPRKHARPAPEADIDSDPVYCLKINADWLPDLLGVLNALDQPDAWAGDSDAIYRARSQVNKMIAQIERCCGCEMKALRQKPGRPSVLQYQDCDGAWFDAFDYAKISGGAGGDTTIDQSQIINNNIDISNQYDGEITNLWPEINEAENDNRNLAWCGAITILVDSICTGAITALENSNANEAERNAAIGAAISGVLAGALSVAAVLAPPATLLAASLATGAAGAGLAAGINSMVALFIPDPTPADIAPYQSAIAKEAVVCCIYEAISILDDVDQDEFQDATLACPFDEGTDEYKIQQAVGAAMEQVMTFLNFAVYARGVYDAINDVGISFPCPCTGWCWNFDFTEEQGDWAATSNWTQGIYVDGLGWTTQDENHDGGGRRALRIYTYAGATVIKKIIVRFNYTPGTYSGNFTGFAIDLDGVRIAERHYSDMPSGSAQEIVWEGTRSTSSEANLVLLMSASLDTSSPYSYSGAILLTSIEVQGEGTSPYSLTDNCSPD